MLFPCRLIGYYVKINTTDMLVHQKIPSTPGHSLQTPKNKPLTSAPHVRIPFETTSVARIDLRLVGRPGGHPGAHAAGRAGRGAASEHLRAAALRDLRGQGARPMTPE